MIGSESDSSTSRRNSHQGEGSSGDVADGIRGPVREEVPGPRVGGTMRLEASSLAPGQRCPAEGVLASEPAWLERRHQVTHGPGLGLVAGSLGQAARQGEDEAEAILEVVELRVPHQPVSVEGPVSQDEPAASLGSEMAEDHLRHVAAPSPVQ